jgi:hypothetical protein
MDFTPLQNLLTTYKSYLVWDFLFKKDNYDMDICKVLGMEKDTCRYWDALWGDYYIEFKKWKSIWLDLVRYSEIIVWHVPDAQRDTVTLFFIPDKERTQIDVIYGIKTSRLIDALGLTADMAHTLINLNISMPRSLNAQASLTVSDIRKIADFSI